MYSGFEFFVTYYVFPQQMHRPSGQHLDLSGLSEALEAAAMEAYPGCTCSAEAIEGKARDDVMVFVCGTDITRWLNHDAFPNEIGEVMDHALGRYVTDNANWAIGGT